MIIHNPMKLSHPFDLYVEILKEALSPRKNARLMLLGDYLEAGNGDAVAGQIIDLLNHHAGDAGVDGHIERAVETVNEKNPAEALALCEMIAAQAPYNAALRHFIRGFYIEHFHEVMEQGSTVRDKASLAFAEVKRTPLASVFRDEAVKGALRLTPGLEREEGLRAAASYVGVLGSEVQAGSYTEKMLVTQWEQLVAQLSRASGQAQRSQQLIAFTANHAARGSLIGERAQALLTHTDRQP